MGFRQEADYAARSTAATGEFRAAFCELVINILK
jgi:hypothetical protein